MDSRGPGASEEACKNQGNGQPSVFTSVADNLDWIKGVMKGTVKPNTPESEKESESEPAGANCNKNSKPTPKPSCHTGH